MSFGPDLPDVDLSTLERAVASLDIAGIGAELRAGLKSIDWKTAFADPKEFFETGASALLLAFKSLLQLVLRTLRACGAAALEVVEKIADWIVRFADARIEIPWLTDFVESQILRGRQLTPLMLLAVAEAVPYTLIYKLAHGTTEGPFSGADDDPDAVSFAAGDADAAKRRARREENALAVTNVVAGFISSLCTTLADLGGDKNVALRSVRLVSCFCGAAICGGTGFPSGDPGLSLRLEHTSWSFNLIGSVIAGADGINALAYAVALGKGKDAKALEHLGEGLKWVTVAWGGVQLVWTLVAAGIETGMVDKSGGEQGIFWLTTASNVLGCAATVTTAIPESALKEQVITNAVLLTLQLGLGLGAFGWKVELDAAADAAPAIAVAEKAAEAAASAGA
jgi:hypothetical protein